MASARYLGLLPLAAILLSLRGQTPAPNAYVDARVCANCHPAIAKTYAQTGMARSFYRPAPSNTVEDFSRGNPFYHQPSRTWYGMSRKDDGYYQRRWRIGPDGKETDVQESRVDFVMGSGNHVRTYLHRNARGALTELPLAWYSEDGGTWAMNPGHDTSYTLPPRSIAYECMFCHNAYPQIPAGHDEPGSEPLYTGALPEGIDCQRCHGPGANHVRTAETKGATIGQLRAAIVNPARLTPGRQMEVCMQCHLETTSRQLPHSIQKYGRGPFSYRPSEPLGNFQIYFDHAPGSQYENDFEIVNSAYRLRKSQCFLQSAGKLTCTTCHNPHDIPRGQQATLLYDRACTQCHRTVAAANHTSASNCVECHMPRRRTVDVIHAVMTDHLIQRRPPARDLLAKIPERQESAGNQYRGPVVPYYPSPLPATGETALYLAVAQVTHKSNLAAGLPQLAAEIARQTPVRAEFYVELGQAWLSAGKPANAIDPLTEASKRRPDSPVVALNLADALTEAGQPARAIQLLDRAIRTSPADPLLWYQLGIAHSTANQEAEAIAALQKAAALDPGLAEPHVLLGALLAGTGDLEQAERELRSALEVNPDIADAAGNLGHLLAIKRDLVQAAYYLGRSAELKPDDAEVRTNYAVTLAGLGRSDDALRQIDAAIRADPKSAEAHNFKGTLLDRNGAHQDAVAEFLEAVRLQPDFGLAHLNAARALAATGDRAAAVQHLRQAANSPEENIRRQAAALLQQLSRQP